jgi:hypothetical protein
MRFVKIVLQKASAVILKLSNQLKLSYIPVLPLHLDIEPINICNFQCSHCKVTYWRKDKQAMEI